MSPNGGLGTEGPDSRGWGLWICSVVMVIIAGFFVIGRIVVRYRKRSLGADDYTIILSLLSSIMLSITEIEAVQHGYGRRFKTIPTDMAVKARMWFFGAQIMYKIVPTLNKISVTFLYYRIFADTSKSFRVFCYVMQAVLISSGLSFTLATVGQCRPIQAFWDMSIKQRVCFRNEPWWMSFSIFHILADVILLAMPIREVLRLKMIRLEKIGLVLIFATGIFVTFTSIFRATTLARSAGDNDPTYGPIPATIWAVIESNSGIICCCLPMLRSPFLSLLRALGFSFPVNTSRPSVQRSRSSRRRQNSQSYPLSSREELEVSSSTGGKKHGHNIEISVSRDSEDRIIRDSLDGSGSASLFSRGIMVTSDIEVASETVGTPVTAHARDSNGFMNWPMTEENKLKYGITWEEGKGAR